MIDGGLQPQVNDVFALLGTHNGQYAAACSLDFSKPPYYYDTFALRDADGKEPIMLTWPYFSASASRNALVQLDPVPVKSCWNGMGMSNIISIARRPSTDCSSCHARRALLIH